MYAEKTMIETDNSGKIINAPKLPANKQIEAIFLVLDEKNEKPHKRKPHSELIGKMKINGDIFDSAPAADWNLN